MCALRPETCDVRPATCDLCAGTCNLRPAGSVHRWPQQKAGEVCGLETAIRSAPMENDTKSSAGPANLHISPGSVARAAKRHPGDLGLQFSGFRSQASGLRLQVSLENSRKLVIGLDIAGIHSTILVQPATCNLQPATCDLRPATCDLRPETFRQGLCIAGRSRKLARYAG